MMAYTRAWLVLLCAVLTVQHSHCNESVDDASAQVAALQRQLRETSEQLRNKVNQVEALSTQLKNKEQKLKKASTSFESVKSSEQKLLEKLERAEAAIEKMEKNKESGTEALKQKLDDEVRKHAVNREEVQKMREHIESLEAHLERVGMETASNEGTVEALRKQLDESRKTLNLMTWISSKTSSFQHVIGDAAGFGQRRSVVLGSQAQEWYLKHFRPGLSSGLSKMVNNTKELLNKVADGAGKIYDDHLSDHVNTLHEHAKPALDQGRKLYEEHLKDHVNFASSKVSERKKTVMYNAKVYRNRFVKKLAETALPDAIGKTLGGTYFEPAGGYVLGKDVADSIVDKMTTLAAVAFCYFYVYPRLVGGSGQNE
jgi:uncharacterized phage infection (PIP) family protein YhgE